MTTTRAQDRGNNAKLSVACEGAYKKFQQKLNSARAHYKGNPDAEKAFTEIDEFFNPLFSKFVIDMQAAPTVQEQKELLLGMIRSSFNESMMVSGQDSTMVVANEFFNATMDGYTQQINPSGAAKFSSKTVKLADPGGSFHATAHYMEIMNKAAAGIGEKPAAEVRRDHGIPMGPVTTEQRSLLLKESEAILRGLGEPFIAADAPFQPDMFGTLAFLMTDPQHMQDLMAHGPQSEDALTAITMGKWQKLQRDYPDMATKVTTLIDASTAAIGRGKETLQ